MFLFLKLVLAHLVADFILQFEELYQLKVKSRLGHVFHALIHWICSLALLAPYLDLPLIWIFVTATSIIHYYQDLLKYSLQARHPRQIFWCFTIDQFFHFLFLAVILVLPELPPERSFGISKTLNFLYTGNLPTLYAIAYITAVFKGSYFLHAFRRSFIKHSRPDHFITSLEVGHALIERGFILTLFLFNIPSPLLLVLCPLIAMLRVPSVKLRNLPDFGMSFLYTAVTGLVFRNWL